MSLANVLEAFNSRHYEIALQDGLTLAEEGSAEAQNLIAKMYFEGIGVSRDLGRAEYWFSKAAANHHADSQVAMSSIAALKGDPHASFNWMRKAAARWMVASFRLGNLYELGFGARQSIENAVRCYEKAAVDGHVPSRIRLAALIATGKIQRGSRLFAVLAFLKDFCLMIVVKATGIRRGDDRFIA